MDRGLQLKRERGRVVRWASVMVIHRLVKAQAAHFKYKKGAFFRGVQRLICARRLFRKFIMYRQHYGPTFEVRTQNTIRHVLIHFSTSKFITRIA